MTPDIAIQLLSLTVYIAAMIWGGLALIDIRKSHHQIAVKYVAKALVVLSIGTALAFASAQTYWTLTGEIRELGFSEAVVWLLYDWLNGLSHLAVVLAVRAFMRWEASATCQAPGGVCPSTRLLHSDQNQDLKIIGLSAEIETLQSRIEHLRDESRD